jgi:hypothetical protein
MGVFGMFGVSDGNPIDPFLVRSETRGFFATRWK